MPQHPSFIAWSSHDPALVPDRLFNKKHTLWLVPISLLLAGCAMWNVPITIFWELLLLLWFSTLPGMLALSRWKIELSLLQRFVLGTALGFGITPLCFILLRSFDAWGYTSLVMSALNVLALAYLSLRGGTTSASAVSPTKRSTRLEPKLIWLCTIAIALVLFYNFAGIHYTSDGSLEMRGLFAIDLPFLIGIMPSFDLYGHLADMHQNGLQYAYHDFTYILIAVVKQVAGAEYFSLIAYSFPVFGMSIVSVALFTFFRSLVESTRAFMLAIAAILLSSIWGDQILTGALSPSYLAGVVLLISLLIVVRYLMDRIGPIRPIGLMGLLFALLLILIKTKLPIYLLIGGSLGILGLLYLRKDRNVALILILPCLLSLPMLFLFSEPNPYQPAGDFVIGAPLMGYGNQLAALIHVSPSDVDPVITHHSHEWEDLLIIPFTIVHIVRMIVLDARLLLFVVAFIFLRRKLLQDHHWLFLLAGTAILLGITLPILYSPAWYPLAISFYTPDLAGLVAGILALVLLSVYWRTTTQFAKIAATLCVLYGCIVAVIHLNEERSSQLLSMSSESVRSLEWIRTHTPADATIVSDRYDLDLSDSTNDESFYLYGALSQRKIVSSGAKYGGLLAAVADYDPLKGLHPVEAAATSLTQRRMDIFTMYRSLNTELIARTMDAYSVDYLLASRDPKTLQLDLPNAQEQFETVHGSTELPVLQLKR